MRIASFVLLVPMLLAGCGTLGRLDTAKGHPTTIRDYDRVVVGEFTASDERGSRNEDKADEQRAAIEVGRKAFADLIAKGAGRGGRIRRSLAAAAGNAGAEDLRQHR
jgi:hypothetical protein